MNNVTTALAYMRTELVIKFNRQAMFFEIKSQLISAAAAQCKMVMHIWPNQGVISCDFIL